MSDLNQVLAQIRPCNIKKPYIFVSYSSRDRETVWRDVLQFQQNGYNIWLDEKNLDKTRESWRDDALTAIQNRHCQLLLFYVSSTSLCSQPCLRELRETRSMDAVKYHNGEVRFVAIDVEEIGDITRFCDQIHKDISEIEDEDEFQKKADALWAIREEFFKSNNDRVRVHPKDEPNRKGDYYSDIQNSFPDKTRLSASQTEPRPTYEPASKTAVCIAYYDPADEASARIISDALKKNGIHSCMIDRHRSFDYSSYDKHVLQGKNILVVDDVDVNRYMLTDMLISWGASCDTAGNGQEAVDKFLSSTYDLIFMDMIMPMMDGYTATQAIRNADHVSAKTVPIIAMAADTRVDDVRKAIDSGVDAYISRPFWPTTVKTTIQQVLDGSQTDAVIDKITEHPVFLPVLSKDEDPMEYNKFDDILCDWAIAEYIDKTVIPVKINDAADFTDLFIYMAPKHTQIYEIGNMDALVKGIKQALSPAQDKLPF